MFVIFYIILSVLYYTFCFIKYILVNLFGLNSVVIDSILSYIKNRLNTLTVSSDLIDINSLDFKDLYLEYSFFNKKNNLNLNSYLTNNAVNTNLLQNYSSDLNLLISIKEKEFKDSISYKKNLNYLSNGTFLKKTFDKFNSQYNKSKYLLNNSKINLVNISKNLESKISSNLIIKYSPSNFIKYIKDINLNTYTILFLRKNKVFNKGRYSRNRQYYRTGVYWCLYVNIVAVVGIYFWFYKLTMNFGYVWWMLYIFICSFIVPKTIKYRLYNPKVLYQNYISNFIWLYFILLNLLPYKNLINMLFINLNKYLKSNIFNLNNSSNIFIVFITNILNILNLFVILIKDNKNLNNMYMFNILNNK